MKVILRRCQALILVVWVGALVAMAALVAPVLFQVLEQAEAGKVVSELFHRLAWSGLICGSLLILVRWGMKGWVWRDAQVILPLLMMVCVAAGYFGLQPLMEASRGLRGDATGGTVASNFLLLHSLSALIYLLQTLFGLVLVWMTATRRSVRFRSRK